MFRLAALGAGILCDQDHWIEIGPLDYVGEEYIAAHLDMLVTVDAFDLKLLRKALIQLVDKSHFRRRNDTEQLLSNILLKSFAMHRVVPFCYLVI